MLIIILFFALLIIDMFLNYKFASFKKETFNPSFHKIR